MRETTNLGTSQAKKNIYIFLHNVLSQHADASTPNEKTGFCLREEQNFELPSAQN